LIKQTLGFGSKEFGIIFAYESVLGFLTQSFFFAKIQSRFGSRKTEFTGLVLMGLGLAMTPLATSFAWLIVCSTAYALGSGVAFPAINADVADRVDESQRTEAYSLLQGARSFGFFVGPVLGGILFDINIRAPYFFAGSVCLVAGLGALLLAHQRTASA
jgi:DHA1 family multidrug resistance protein-like MFS transporter